MKQKYEGKNLQGLLDLGREQGYLTFDQLNDFLPQDVASPTDLRAALDSFEDMDIKVLDEVPSGDSDGDIEVEAKEEPDEAAEVATPADSLGESSDPVRLYLKEMGNFQLLSRGAGSRNREEDRGGRKLSRRRGAALTRNLGFCHQNGRAGRAR